VIELPLINPDLFIRVGIKPPKGVLLYGPVSVWLCYCLTVETQCLHVWCPAMRANRGEEALTCACNAAGHWQNAASSCNCLQY
jgi:hypothetical protein